MELKWSSINLQKGCHIQILIMAVYIPKAAKWQYVSGCAKLGEIP
jgi:hypothetical protein